jgi:hypothetical protein
MRGAFLWAPAGSRELVCAFCRGVLAHDYMFCTLCHLSRDRHRPGPKIRGKFGSAGIVAEGTLLRLFGGREAVLCQAADHGPAR